MCVYEVGFECFTTGTQGTIKLATTAPGTVPFVDSGESRLSHPWIDRLTHDACRDMSSDVPYPAVVNSCKAGYR